MEFSEQLTEGKMVVQLKSKLLKINAVEESIGL